MEITTEQLLQIIGAKQVQIEALQAQLRAVSLAYEEQRKLLEKPEPAEDKKK
jgi:hypothetical protein